ncbi:MAG: oxygen-independent coproporphyrinogen III oxidase [Bacteroidetes bacterium]|nr:MAG: oxygen-independent coproporphyrinogen III oxidase [Bacteroidota bacterium]
MKDLVKKYNVPGPRYTSYPTVPFWKNTPSELEWIENLNGAIASSCNKAGIYIHLPYCESLCTYCGCNTRITVNHSVEEPYVKAVLDEWKMYLTSLPALSGIAELHLGGGTPTFFSPSNLQKLIQGILKETDGNIVPVMSFEGHPSSTSSGHLKILAELGFNRISLGIQDFDPIVQAAINRKQSFNEVKSVTESAREYGYDSVNYDVIFGLPFQTLQSIEDTIRKVILLRPDRIAFYSYAHVPWMKPGQRKYSEKDIPDGEEKLSLYKKGKDIFLESGYVEIGMDHFALKSDDLYKAMTAGKLHRNFMGYTVAQSSAVIGLGVSAIGDSWNAFAQNKKIVEDYIQNVSEGKFPIFRGHLLSERELKLRKIILDLMCNFKASLNCFENDDLLIQSLVRLESLKEDGLVQTVGHTVLVTDSGRPFIRNICMAFDESLWMENPESQMFSSTV